MTHHFLLPFMILGTLKYALLLFVLWLLADFVTGVIHWWEDAYGNPHWPIIGKLVIEPNLTHHKNPRKLLEGSYWHRIDTSVYAAIGVGGVLYLFGIHSLSLIIFLAFAANANEIHAISHRTDKENGRLIIFLQRIGILQTRKSHGWHHKAPYDTNFCVMTEYLNPILNKVRFWERLEYLLLRIFKIPVLRGSDIRGGI